MRGHTCALRWPHLEASPGEAGSRCEGMTGGTRGIGGSRDALGLPSPPGLHANIAEGPGVVAQEDGLRASPPDPCPRARPPDHAGAVVEVHWSQSRLSSSSLSPRGPPCGGAREAPAGVLAPGGRQEGRLVHTWVGAWLRVRAGAAGSPGGVGTTPAPRAPGRSFQSGGTSHLRGWPEASPHLDLRNCFHLMQLCLKTKQSTRTAQGRGWKPAGKRPFLLISQGCPSQSPVRGLRQQKSLSHRSKGRGPSHVLCR